MRFTAVLGLVLAAALASPALAQSFVGDWTATAHLQGADVSETLHVSKTGDGYSVEAKALNAPPDAPNAGPGADIVIDGDKFSYNRSLTTPNGPIVISYSGVVSGDTFTGAAKLGDMPIPYTGVRIAAGK